MRRNEIIVLCVAIAIFAAVVFFLILKDIVITPQAIELIILFVLMLVTITYAKRTAEIAAATEKQAQEMKEQRVMSSRPVIIQKAVKGPLNAEGEEVRQASLSHFVVMNAGNGPAIELEVLLMDKERIMVHGRRETFLRAGESKDFHDFYSDLVHQESTCYLLCQYQGVFSRTSREQTWYQTWLPFELAKSSEGHGMDVKPGQLEFREVSEKDRIDAFSTGSKPK